MSPNLHYEIARAYQQEMVNRATDSHRIHTTPRAVNRQRSIKQRLVPVIAAVGICTAAGTAVTVNDAHADQPSRQQHTSHVSSQQLKQEIRTYEAKGFVATSCTIGGTLMRNYRTGQSVTVKW
jgi:hypothetical protein